MVAFNNESPKLKPWPEGYAQIVCNNLIDFTHDSCRGHCVESTCEDCGAMVGVDSFTLDYVAKVAPNLKPKTICIDCLATYERIEAENVLDLRRKKQQ